MTGTEPQPVDTCPRLSRSTRRRSTWPGAACLVVGGRPGGRPSGRGPPGFGRGRGAPWSPSRSSPPSRLDGRRSDDGRRHPPVVTGRRPPVATANRVAHWRTAPRHSPASETRVGSLSVEIRRAPLPGRRGGPTTTRWSRPPGSPPSTARLVADALSAGVPRQQPRLGTATPRRPLEQLPRRVRTGPGPVTVAVSTGGGEPRAGPVARGTGLLVRPSRLPRDRARRAARGDPGRPSAGRDATPGSGRLGGRHLPPGAPGRIGPDRRGPGRSADPRRPPR